MRIVKASADIDKILKKGTKVYSNAFVLFYLPVSTEGLEFAAIAGKKVFKRAVDRNHAKRRIRELVRATCSHLSGMQIALMARKPIGAAKYADLKDELEKVVHSLRV